MKGFHREETRFSLCGLNCALCVMHLGGHCPGCGGGPGNQNCAIARCSLEHGNIPFCWECPKYPCTRYNDFDAYDSFVPHRNREQDVARVQALGLESYLQKLEEKRSVLDKLLIRWNDGRRKTFFDTAVYLLPLEEFRSMMDALEHQPQLAEQPVEERASAAVSLFQEVASRQDVHLKLNKKSKKE